MEYFFSWCINQIVSCICLMMVFFSAYILVYLLQTMVLCIIAHELSAQTWGLHEIFAHTLRRCLFLQWALPTLWKMNVFLQCRFHFEVSSFDCNLMCFGVEGINFGVQLDVCWSWTWFKKKSSNLFNFYRFCTLTDWHIDRLDVIHIQRYSDIYSSSDISISVHLYSI